ncbi:MAG: hypothetical protein NTV08_20540 [Verrucomicrobia bacterium]|nr:hypothetical protein [Verrucomicrobiota bacterium]
MPISPPASCSICSQNSNQYLLSNPENANDPWLSLVFGRDRALGAWAAEGFGDEQIDEACLFLLGACPCEVKRMNPGWDLLLNADWVESLRAIAAAVLLVLGSAASWFTFRRQP